MRRMALIAGLLLAGLLLTLPTPAAAAPERLDRLAAELRTSPLAVDDDLRWLISAAQRRALVADLRASEVPYHVALAPELDEDESGGDSARMLQGLYDRLREPGVYVVVDGRGAFDEASADVPRKLAFPFSLALGDSDERNPTATVTQRLRAFVRLSDRAPAGPAKRFDTTDPLPLPALGVKRGADGLAIVAAAIMVGILCGALLYGLGLAGARLLGGRRARS